MMMCVALWGQQAVHTILFLKLPYLMMAQKKNSAGLQQTIIFNYELTYWLFSHLTDCLFKNIKKWGKELSFPECSEVVMMTINVFLSHQWSRWYFKLLNSISRRTRTLFWHYVHELNSIQLYPISVVAQVLEVQNIYKWIFPDVIKVWLSQSLFVCVCVCVSLSAF